MQKQNARARAAGGFKVGEDLTKNRRAEAFYRRAIDDEMQKMLSSLYSRLAEVYTPVRVENAAPLLECHPELVSRSHYSIYPLVLICKIYEMLKRVQHDSLVWGGNNLTWVR